MLGMPVASAIQHIDNFDIDLLAQRKIEISQHCYGCTAGNGSSCQGAMT